MLKKAFSVFSLEDNARYIRDGHLYPSIEAAQNQYSTWFSNSPAGQRSLSFDPIFYDVLSADIVIATAIGNLVLVDSTNEKTEWNIGYSILWTKEEDGWRILNMHTSIP
jgi:hypothetical protein